MDDLAGKNAFITGGASGIGFAIAKALLNEGMNVAIVDVDRQALDEAAQALDGANAKVVALQLDVTDRDRYAEVATEVGEQFGAIHVLCNNAGVYRGASMDQVTYEDWDWVMGVNVGGVVNGLQNFIKQMQAHGEGGHIVNTASMAGLTTSPGLGVYNSSKFAVVGMSEALRADLEPHGIGVSVLCPGMVRTKILESERTRPTEFDVTDEAAEEAAKAHSEIMNVAMNTGIEASEVAELVVHGIKTGQFYLLPHPEMKEAMEVRAEEILNSFGEADPARVAAHEEFLSALLPSKNN
ncbi:MAG: short-chain dehydrogenase [Gammaproteobacteria bacterium]|nr:short-chain dehydrogenase [Gammaproteobacteria bacterium]